MIQDRLTAKFQSAKPAQRREAKPQPVKPVTKTAKQPAADKYTKGRRLMGTFWL